MKIIVYLVTLITCNAIFSQEITVTIDTLKIVYKEYSVKIPYKFKNESGKEITFLDKKEFSASNRCYVLNRSKSNFYDIDTIRAIEDFKTLQPGEEIEREVLLFIYWPCRSAPHGSLHATYSSKITDEDNYYNYINSAGVTIKMFINAWTGTISSKSFLIFDK